MTVEQRLARLEAIVDRLEGEPVDLAEALALFEEGVACLRDAAGTLSEAEARVRKLTELADGAFAVEPLDDD
ncbi:MAG: exodeoxyribonuclease VII small subunit [Gemmatimonadaceae bacterium]|nr:exodeoxyribonuclease VII small subunit [Gemmatimonadaceae bacterium]NUO94222.1 exodeoxyribonuclease VII small subunit [Gemmatimonadaceae bacterium]NUP71201.1 exodeoxyribonuclease VII small subunit [Gemmatimonadaceae bacterium]NUR34589.1 exodeoxyribonuclease VII small subunit [Gemmatimonadaceae bacterium]NUS34421.1 exodeoxyribonuclease VII small subunit [Gemmatimonadaceae bacterium]